MNRFEGKIALITGGRSGIGKAIARKLCDEGAHIITAQRGDDSEFESIHADFSDPATPAKLVEEVVQRRKQIDILVNNAGIMFETSIKDTSLADWQTAMMVNLTAPFLLIQAALPYLQATKGTIINIGSIEGLGANPLHTAYSASKAGLQGLTRAVAVDLGADAITCNAIAPGWIDTELNEDFINAMPDPAKFRHKIASIHPAARTGTPEDVAALAAFLASEESRFITGQTYVIDGGRMTKLSLPDQPE